MQIKLKLNTIGYVIISKNSSMGQDYLDMGEEDVLEEEMERALKKEESAKKLKVILFVMLPLLIAFLLFYIF